MGSGMEPSVRFVQAGHDHTGGPVSAGPKHHLADTPLLWRDC